MDVQSGILMVLSTLGLMLLLALLISILVKPARRLKVNASFDENKEEDKSVIALNIENIGKKPMNIVYLYANFHNRLSHKKVLLTSSDFTCSIPHFIKKGEILQCKLDVEEYLNSLKEQSFEILSIKIAVANSVSMEYVSNSLEL